MDDSNVSRAFIGKADSCHLQEEQTFIDDHHGKLTASFMISLASNVSFVTLSTELHYMMVLRASIHNKLLLQITYSPTRTCSTLTFVISGYSNDGSAYRQRPSEAEQSKKLGNPLCRLYTPDCFAFQ